MELIERIVGTEDPDLLRLLHDAQGAGQGSRSDLSPRGDSPRSHGGMDAIQAAQRLAREAPAEYEAVRRGEKSIHAAAVSAGIRRRRVSVRLDDAASAVGARPFQA